MIADPGAALLGLPLTPDLAAEIDKRLATLRIPLAERAPSDLTFSNLYLFREAHAYRYLPGAWPCIAGRAYDGVAIRLPLFDIALAPSPVLQELQGADDWFFPLADEVLARLDPGTTIVRSVRDDADYLYDASAFLDYSNTGLGPKRHAVARLLASTHIEVMSLDGRNRSLANDVLEGWCADKGRSLDYADATACREALESMTHGGPLQGYLHVADGTPAGFVIAEALNAGVLVVRFAKGRARFDGIFAHMFQDLARRLAPELRWLNFEQDLGKANFRQTKLSFRPAALLRKHRVRVRTH